MKNKKVLIISIITLLVVICATVLTILYFTTDLFKTEQQLFYKYLAQTEIMDLNFIKQLNIANEKLTKNSNSSSANLNLLTSVQKQETGVADVREILTIKSNALSNVVTNQSYRDFTLSQNNQNIVTLRYIRDANMYGIGADNILAKYLAVENANLKDLFTKIGVEDVSGLPDSIPTNYKEILKIDEVTLNKLKETYGTLIYNNISKEKFYKVNNQDKTETIAMSLTEEEVLNLLKLILETAKNDTALIDLIINKAELLNYNNITIENIQTEIQKIIDDLQIDDSTNNGVNTISDSFRVSAKPLKLELIKKDQKIIGLNYETIYMKKKMSYSNANNMEGLLSSAENFSESKEEIKERIEINLSNTNNIVIAIKENEIQKNNIMIDYSYSDSTIGWGVVIQDKSAGENIRNFPKKLKLQYQINNYATDNITEKIVINTLSDSQENIQIELVNNTILKQDVIISKLTTENSAKLNDMTSEELEQLFIALVNRIKYLYGDRIPQ